MRKFCILRLTNGQRVAFDIGDILQVQELAPDDFESPDQPSTIIVLCRRGFDTEIEVIGDFETVLKELAA